MYILLLYRYYNLLYQCFINHYQSVPVFYITILPMITNKLPSYTITNHSVGNFLPIGSQCFTNHKFTPMVLGNFPIAANVLPLVPIGIDIHDMYGTS